VSWKDAFQIGSPSWTTLEPWRFSLSSEHKAKGFFVNGIRRPEEIRASLRCFRGTPSVRCRATSEWANNPELDGHASQSAFTSRYVGLLVGRSRQLSVALFGRSRCDLIPV
jgi:hypothetical protein